MEHRLDGRNRRAAARPTCADQRGPGRGRGGGDLETTPANATHWSRAKMAERTGLSKSTIGRIWCSFDLKPHRADGFKLSNDPLFVEKVYDVVGLHLNPPEAAVVALRPPRVQALEADIRAWVNAWNDNPKPFIWTKTRNRSSNHSDDFSNELPAAGH